MDASQRRFELSVLPELFAIVRLPASTAVPPWATLGAFYSVTRTADELSIACPSANVPGKLAGEERWRAFKVHGPFPLSEVGVLAALAKPLAAAKVSIFVVSTFDTDYLLVRSEEWREALAALQNAGHKVHGA